MGGGCGGGQQLRRTSTPFPCPPPSSPRAQLAYEGLGIEMVLECTGVFLTRAKLQPYFDKGAKKVIVSAPVKDDPPVLNIVVGCNEVGAGRDKGGKAGEKWGKLGRGMTAPRCLGR